VPGWLHKHDKAWLLWCSWPWQACSNSTFPDGSGKARSFGRNEFMGKHVVSRWLPMLLRT
jgi:hypothetical protein